MKKTVILLAVVMLVAFVTAAQAEVRAGSFSVTPFIGGYVFEGNEYYRGFKDKKNGFNTLEDSYAVGLRAGYNFTKNLGMEGFFGYIPTSREHVKSDKCKDIDIYNYGIEGIYNFMPDSRFVPFLAIGIGGINYNPPGNESNGDKFSVDYGAGLKYFLTDNVALRADVRHVLPLNEKYNDLLYSVGITFAFGGKKEVKEPPPVARPEIIEKGRKTIDVKFDFDKSTIKAGYYKDIDDLVQVMKDYPEIDVVVTEGHTCNMGQAAYNKKLSQRRAEAVKRYMVKAGIDTNRIEAKGFGEEQPVASNKTKEGRAQNRRVEAVVEYIISK